MISKLALAAFIGYIYMGTFSACVQAQAPAPAPSVSQLVNLRGVEAVEISSPNFEYSLRGTNPVRDGRLNWLQVQAEYDTAPKWLDEITFTFYVVLQGKESDLPEGAKQNNLFSGTVSYINVPQARRMVASMFLDPNTFARYGRPTYSAVVVTINGQPAAGMANPKSSEASQWWTRETPNQVPLLTRKETPFALVEHDRLPTIQP